MGVLYNLKKGISETTDLKPGTQIIAANGAITIPDGGEVTVIVTKGTAAAITIPPPTATVHDGVKIVVVSDTAAAHTVTATTIGFNKGNAASDVGTFGGAIGDGFAFMAYQGEWLVLANINVTLA